MKHFLHLCFVLILFSIRISAQTDILIADFENSISGTYYYAPGGTASIVDNPFPDGVNNSTKVLQFDKDAGTYKLLGFGFPDLQIKVKEVKEVQFLIYSDNFNSLYVSTENTLDPRTSEIHKIWAKPYGTSNVWYKVTVPLNKPDPLDTLGTLGYLNIFPNMEDDAAATFYIDSVKLVLFPTGLGVEGVTVDPNKAELVVNEKRFIEALIEPEEAENKNVVWESTNPEVASVDATGMVTALAAGTAKIFVTTEEGGFTDTCYITVTDVVPVYPEIIANFEDVVPSDDPGEGIWQIYSWNGTREIIPNPVKDENNNTDNVLHYTKNAGATWSGFGFFYQDGIYTTPELESLELMVYGVQWTKLFIKVEGIRNGFPVQTFYETPYPWNTPSPAGSWNKIVIPIGPNLANGRIKNINIMCADASAPFEVYFDQLKINYIVHVASVELNKTNLELAIGENEYLEAVISPENASNKNVIWESSDPSVASVNSLGKVTAVAPGTATITVTTQDGSKTATCEVTVVEATGINSGKASTGIVYPNPITGKVIHVSVPSITTGMVQFTIMDVAGRVIKMHKMPANGTGVYELSVSLAPGNYLLNITGNGVNNRVKLIVK